MGATAVNNHRNTASRLASDRFVEAIQTPSPGAGTYRPTGRSLRDAAIRSRATPGYHRVSDRLYIQVTVNKHGLISRSWIMRYRFAGRSVELGLGPYPTVSLYQASVKRDRLVLMLIDGLDPKTELQARRRIYLASVISERKRDQPTFAECAERLHEVKRPEWKNEKHAKQWISTLSAYVFPALGNTAIDAIRARDLIEVLQPIWYDKTETAYRVRDRVFQVLQWAVVQGMRKSDEGLEAMVRSAFPAAGKLLSQKRKHFAALPYTEVPAFIRQFNATGVPDIVKLLHEFTILNGNRSGEARGATWDEIDLPNKRWVIDKRRMKMGVEHRIPLSRRAIEILNQAKSMQVSDNNLVFPSPNTGRMISDSTLTNRFREMGATHTVHGYRSAMRDWAAEKTKFAWEVMEKALAHRVGGETEAAYFRSDLFEKRARMMEAWAVWCSAKKTSSVR